MKLERSNVEFAIWRKKVDASLFEHNGTTIPEWACKMWNLRPRYGEITSRKDKRATAQVRFEGKAYEAWVTTAPHGRSSPAFRLWYDPSLSVELKRTFSMSYMRSLEGFLDPELDAEHAIPFWEFLDIEFDPDGCIFRFVAHYRQEPTFPNLFNRLVGSPALKSINDEVKGKQKVRIHKQCWKPRADLKFELGAINVIYFLFDSAANQLYIGEADNLIKRLSQPHDSIPKWDHFRYNVLPASLETFRVELERMLIRDFAAALENKREIPWKNLSGCVLANDKIDIEPGSQRRQRREMANEVSTDFKQCEEQLARVAE